MKILSVTFFVLIMIAGLKSQANTGDAAVFNSVYPASRSFTNFNCAICHQNIAVNTNLTSYGANYKGMGRNQTTSFTGIEAIDSDADGYNNLSEITAGSNPGDAMSNPNNVPMINTGGGGGGGGDDGAGDSQNHALEGGDFDLKNSNMLAKTSCASVSEAEMSSLAPSAENLLILILMLFFPLLLVAVLKSHLQVLS